MEVHKAELFYTDPNTKQEKTIIAEGKDVGDAAQNAVHLFSEEYQLTCYLYY